MARREFSRISGSVQSAPDCCERICCVITSCVVLKRFRLGRHDRGR